MVLEDREMLFCSFTPTPHCTNFPHFYLRRQQVTLVNIKSDGGRRKKKGEAYSSVCEMNYKTIRNGRGVQSSVWF